MVFDTLVDLEQQRQMWALMVGPERRIKVLLPQVGEEHQASEITDTTTLAKL